MNIKKHKGWLAASAFGAAVGLTGCFGGGDNEETPAPPAPPVVVQPPVAPSVPVADSAGASVSAFIAFLLTLSATDETSGPGSIGGAFAVPADETSQPQPLT